MSLQVWLPLNGNLNNLGLASGNIVSNNITYENTGKIGGKSLSGGTITLPAAMVNTFYNKNHMSFAFWLYAKGTSGSSVMIGQSPMSAGNNRMYSIFQYSTPLDLHLSWQDETSNSTFLGGVWNGFFTENQWVHCTIVYNGTKALIYRNGVYYGSANGTSNRAVFNYDVPINGSSIRLLNDIRIYDHALSVKEVEEIAKGLVLHYKLDNGGGKNNNIKLSTIVNRGCTSFTYNKSTAEWTAVCPINSSTWGFGFYINDSSIKWAYGETWVISLEVYTPQAITWNCDINNKPDLADISSYTGNDYDITGQRKVNTNGVNGSKNLQPGWNKIWFSQTASGSTYGLSNYTTNWGIVTTSLTDPITIKLRNIKGEIFQSGEVISSTPFISNNKLSNSDEVKIYSKSFISLTSIAVLPV